jgi:hypothetical protein
VSNFHNKLSAKWTAAFGLLLLVTTVSRAGIIYSGPVNLSPPGFANHVNFDLNLDGTNDFEFGTTNDPDIMGEEREIFFKGLTGKAYVRANDVVFFTFRSFKVVQAGQIIDSNFLNPYPFGVSVTGDGDLNGYVGLDLVNGTNTNFGWAHFSATNNGQIYGVDITLVDYAYETVPGLGIMAGATNEASEILPLSIESLSTNNVVLNWGIGILQSSPQIIGPYADLTNATPPYLSDTSAMQQFFRVRIPQ